MKKLLMSIGLLLCLSLSSNAQDWKVQLGEASPYFEVTGKNNEKITSESLRGKVVLLNFFATWCPPCRHELPRLQKEIWEDFMQYQDLAVLVLGREEGWDKLNPFMETNQYTFPVYPDLKREVFSLFADQSIPRNVVLDRNGKIIYQSIGYENEEFSYMAQLIKEELEKK